MSLPVTAEALSRICGIGCTAPLSADDPLKTDIRAYACRGHPLLFAARTYQGQTTNFRTPGGGFAPVLTLVETSANAQAPGPT